MSTCYKCGEQSRRTQRSARAGLATHELKPQRNPALRCTDGFDNYGLLQSNRKSEAHTLSVLRREAAARSDRPEVPDTKLPVGARPFRA